MNKNKKDNKTVEILENTFKELETVIKERKEKTEKSDDSVEKEDSKCTSKRKTGKKRR